MCSVLDLPLSTDYSKVNSKKTSREIENEKLKIAILKYYKESKYIYVNPKLKILLSKNGLNIPIKKIQWLMR